VTSVGVVSELRIEIFGGNFYPYVKCSGSFYILCAHEIRSALETENGGLVL
jgi:hypothetical protein